MATRNKIMLLLFAFVCLVARSDNQRQERIELTNQETLTKSVPEKEPISQEFRVDTTQENSLDYKFTNQHVITFN